MCHFRFYCFFNFYQFSHQTFFFLPTIHFFFSFCFITIIYTKIHQFNTKSYFIPFYHYPAFTKLKFSPPTMNIIIDTLPFSLSALGVLAIAHKILPPFKSFLDYSHYIYQDPLSASHTTLPSSKFVSCYSAFSLSLARKLVLYQFVLNAIIYATLTSAIITVELVLCEIGDWLSPDSRIIVWKLTTSILIVMLVLAIPLLEIFTVIYTSHIQIISKLKYPLIASSFSLWLFLFYYLGLFIPFLHPICPQTFLLPLLSDRWLPTTTIITLQTPAPFMKNPFLEL